MDIDTQIEHLTRLLDRFLHDQGSLKELAAFSWRMIDYYSALSQRDLPPYAEKEKEFWYAIWLIQHLADIEHERDGTTQRALEDAFDYLRGAKTLPQDFRGSRP